MSDQEYGNILEVFLKRTGGETVSDVSIGETIIPMDDCYEFSESGGQVVIWVNGDETDVVFEYTGYDDEASTLLISQDPIVDENGDPVLDELGSPLLPPPPLTVNIEAQTSLFVYPISAEKRAWVQVKDDDGDEPLSVRVPHSMDAVLSEFVRTDLTGYESVGIEEDESDWVLTDIIGEPAVINADALDPDTIPVPPSSDGLAPTASPGLVLRSAGIGGLIWSVDAVLPNADPQRYRVYAEAVVDPANVTIDAAHLIADTGSLFGSFFDIGGVPLLPADPETPPLTYAVKAVAYDADGSAPVGLPSNLATPRRATNAEISADFGYFGSIEAQQIMGGSILTDLVLAAVLSVGQDISIEPAWVDGEELKGGFVIYQPKVNPSDPDEPHIPLITLHPSGSTFRGRVIADDISILKGLIIQSLAGSISHLASEAILQIDNGIADPTAPSMSSGVTSSSWPSIPAGYTERGICWDSTNGKWWQLLWKSSIKRAYIRTISTAGVASSVGTYLATSDAVAVSNISYAGGFVFIQVSTSFSGLYDMRLEKYNATSRAFVDTLWIISYKGTLAVFAASASDVDVYGTDLDRSRGYVSIVRMSDGYSVKIADADVDSQQHFRGLALGSFDRGTSLWQLTASNGQVYHFTPQAFASPGPILVAAPSHNYTVESDAWQAYKSSGTDIGFYSSKGDSRIAKYGSYFPSAGEKFYAKYADTSGVNTTAASPVSSGIAVPARRLATVVLNPSPSGSTTSDVWVGYGTTTPPTFYKRSETLSSRTLLLTNNKDVSGGTTVPTVNTLGGSPAELKDEIGNSWRGDGVIDFPGLKQHAANRSQAVAQTLTSGGGLSLITNLATVIDPDTGITYASGGLTTTRAGIYVISAVTAYSSSSTVGARITEIRSSVNGTLTYAAQGAAPSVPSRVHATWTGRLAVGETINLGAYQNSGGNLATLVGETRLSMTRISA